jgi:hypothetical protein
VERAAGTPATQDANGNWVRIVDAGQRIGITSLPTGAVPRNFFRLIQTETGYTITMHPW